MDIGPILLRCGSLQVMGLNSSLDEVIKFGCLVAIASGDKQYIEEVRKAQLGIDMPNVVCVDAKGLQLNEDNLHLSTEAQVELGNMLAQAYIKHFLTCNL
ncbi:putative carbohydrate esterase [Ananas comosus]|nr:putative carbohydrate esterase [Ananas comosus]